MAPASKSCLFCRIAGGDEPASFAWRDEHIVVFLDTHPLFRGHALVVPVAHHDTLTDLPVDAVAPLYSVVQRVAKAMMVLGADGTFVAQNNVVSQSVPHVHVHVVPRAKKDGLRGFFWPRVKYASDDERAGYATRLAHAMMTPAE